MFVLPCDSTRTSGSLSLVTLPSVSGGTTDRENSLSASAIYHPLRKRARVCVSQYTSGQLRTYATTVFARASITLPTRGNAIRETIR